MTRIDEICQAVQNYSDLIGVNMDIVLEYLPGQLKCENCIYNDNCENKWKRCVANYIDVGDVIVHLAFCDKKFNKGVVDEVVEILNNLK